MAGYLKVVSQQNTDDGFYCSLKIPNREVRSLYQKIIYDILIIPKDTTQPGIILELKRVLLPKAKPDDDAMELLLEEKAKEALEQIENQQYAAEIQQRGVTNIVKMGLAFCGKRFKLLMDGV